MRGITARALRRALGTIACVAGVASVAHAQGGGGGGGGGGSGGGGAGGAGSGSAGSGGAGSGSGNGAGTGSGSAGARAGSAAGAASSGATGGIGLQNVPSGPPTDTAGVAVDLPPFRTAATLTRSQAVARAIDLSPTTARAGAVIRLARSAERVAYSEYLPSVSVNSSVLRSGTPVLAGQSLTGVIGPTGIGTGGTITTGSDSSGTSGGGFGGTFGSGTSSSTSSSSTGPALSRNVRAPVGQTGGGTGGGTGGSTTTTTATPTIGTSAYMTFVAGYDVFTGGRRSADNRRARAETRAAEAISVSQRFVVVEQVETVFYDVRRSEDLEAVALAQVRRAAEDARQAGRRRAVGTATPADVLQFELLLNNARVAYAQAAIQRRASAYALGRLTGVPGAVEARIDTAIVPRPLTLTDTAIVALALRSAPTLVAARDSARAAEAGIGAARAQYLPTIRLGTSYTMAPNTLGLAAARPGWAVALTTSYPIFNGSVREYQVDRAAAASQVAQVSAADAEREARSEVERRLGNIALTAQQVRLSQTAVQVARESYRVQNVRYGAGVATVLDLSNAEQQLTQAEQQLVNATYDYALARTSLNAFVGREL